MGIFDLDTFARARMALRLAAEPLERIVALNHLAGWLTNPAAHSRLAVSGVMALAGIYRLRVLAQEFELAPRTDPLSEADFESLARVLATQLPEGHVRQRAAERYEQEHNVWAAIIDFKGTEIDAVSVKIEVDREPLILPAIEGFGMPFDLQLGMRHQLPFAWAEEVLARLFRRAASSRSPLNYEAIREMRLVYPEPTERAIRSVVPGLLIREMADPVAFMRALVNGYGSARYHGLDPDRYPTSYPMPGDREQDNFTKWLSESGIEMAAYTKGPITSLPWPGRD